jgi:ubiquinone/menaquinone biosynthesis C-methylase UbiE
MHRKYFDIKTRLLANTPPVIVELGPGTGANLRYLPAGTRLIAIEPNRRMHDVLRRRAKQRGIELDLRELDGEALDLTSSSVDFVFASLVLCTVAKPERVISEVLRVLRPGGRFACVEHVAAPINSRVRSLQRVLAHPWRWVFEGCDLCRDTGSTLQRAGFSRIDVQPIVASTIFVPLKYQIAATCVK